MNAVSLLKPPLPQGNETQWLGLAPGATTFAIAKLAEQIEHPLLVLADNMQRAEQYFSELTAFSNNTFEILFFPDWETLPYDHFSPHEDIISERISTLKKLSQLKHGIILAALPTVMYRLAPRSFICGHSLSIKVGENIELNVFAKNLVENGYKRTAQVFSHGEFAVRGALLDVFPMGSEVPFRIELLGDTVESLRSFDPETQRSAEKMASIQLLQANEFPLDAAAIQGFREKWRSTFSGNPLECPIYEQISQGKAATGVEYYLPLFFEKLESFFDYLPEQTVAIFPNVLMEPAEQFWQEIESRHEQLRYDVTRPLCAPQEIFLPPNECFHQLKKFSQVKIRAEGKVPEASVFHSEGTVPGASATGEEHKLQKGVYFSTHVLPPLLLQPKSKDPAAALKLWRSQFDGTVVFCAESSGRREVLHDLLKEWGIEVEDRESWIASQALLARNDDTASSPKNFLIVHPLSAGFISETPRFAMITEFDLLGTPVRARRSTNKSSTQDPALLVRHLNELKPGDIVVHFQHGIGRYLGLETIQTGEIAAEYITLEYAGGAKIYVPIHAMHLLNRYVGTQLSDPQLTQLGSKQWQQAKEKAAKRIHDVAAELLVIYSHREAADGFAFHAANADFIKFRKEFPFTETVDQTKAIDAVIADMTSTKCMDRLVCGDVGFGKTEVAMQAAFLAVQSGKQVAILVPTTLLASQHLQNFQDRFASWPIKIAAFSRFQSPKEQQETLQLLKAGKMDIVIGTHRLLNPDVEFKDLGLMIIDEEHRFGVQQKEKLKKFRAHVDILTLTATPIPRTLNFSLHGMRDLSIIATPPAKRLSIKTFVREYSRPLIREAILREMLRGGQIYYVHNDVATIQMHTEKLKELVPETSIIIGHGQMPERELERVMLDFYHQKYHVLVATTIIESGIDIPSANTIIIDRADRFGLAQLHQLRGRVGRSHHQAYAYLFTPEGAKLNADAEKRLDAISQLEELGAGFNLAMHDLEIRGAGELLGEQQSGQIDSVGFSLYTEMLEQAVRSLKKGEPLSLDFLPESTASEVELPVTALIPEEYVNDVSLRLSLYKCLADCETVTEIDRFRAELTDRFGKLPVPCVQLFAISHLRVMAKALGIRKIEGTHQSVYFHFNDHPNIQVATLLKLVQTESAKYQLQGQKKLRYLWQSKTVAERLEEVKKVLLRIT